MALSEAQNEWLTVLLENLSTVRSKLQGRSRDFVDDQVKRHDEYGERMFLSPKQKAWLISLHEQHCPGVELPDPEADKPKDSNHDHDPRDDDEIPF
jgi:hypothetical protein